MALSAKRSRAKYPERLRDRYLRADHGIGILEYNAMHDAQRGLCAICSKPETDIHNVNRKAKRLAIDHDHATGEIRGLLCAKCNRGLGMFLDSPQLLFAAADYIENHAAAQFDVRKLRLA